MNRDLFRLILGSPDRFPNLWNCRHATIIDTCVVNSLTGETNYTQIFRSPNFYYPTDAKESLFKSFDDLERILCSDQEPKQGVRGTVPFMQMGSRRNRVLEEGSDNSLTLGWLRPPTIIESRSFDENRSWVFEVTVLP